MLEKLGDQILYSIEVSSFVRFCPNEFLYHFFSDPGPKNDQRPQGNLRAYFETSIKF